MTDGSEDLAQHSSTNGDAPSEPKHSNDREDETTTLGDDDTTASMSSSIATTSAADTDTDTDNGNDADSGDDTESAHTSVDDTPKRSLTDRLRSIDRVELLIVTAIAVMLVVFAWGVSLGVTGEDRYRLPTLIESVQPVPDAIQTDPSTAIIVDLDEGYTGVISVDGTIIETISIDQVPREPGQQVDLPPATIYEPGNATLTFRPQAGSAFERWEPGDHVAEVTYWKVTEGEGRARNFTWNFRVT